jgi:hypothetical protein
MATTTVAPSTVDGIKRLAKKIKRAQSIPHHEALALASKQAGFQNLRHAQKQLALASDVFPVYLTAYWRENRTGGRETVRVLLPRALPSLIQPRQVRFGRNLERFKMVADDHLERAVDVDGQARAKEQLARAAETLHFMAVTGLRPAATEKEWEPMRFFSKMPERDHGSEWISRETGEWVYLNEPYPYKHDLGGPWAVQHQLATVSSSWKGLYYPGAAVPTLFCQSPETADRLHRELEQLARRGDAVAGSEAGPYWVRYASPSQLASKRRLAPRAMPAPRGIAQKGALPYGASRGGEKSDWRPAERMALDLHLQIGPTLAGLMNGAMPDLAYRRIRRVRSTLDDWIQMEYPTDVEMSSQQFGEAYYGHSHLPSFEDAPAQLRALDDVVGKLMAGYADCRPRSEIVNQLGEARASIQKRAKS